MIPGRGSGDLPFVGLVGLGMSQALFHDLALAQAATTICARCYRR